MKTIDKVTLPPERIIDFGDNLKQNGVHVLFGTAIRHWGYDCKRANSDSLQESFSAIITTIRRTYRLRIGLLVHRNTSACFRLQLG